MTSYARFNTWQNTAGTPYGAILQVASVTTQTQEAFTLGGATENRGFLWADPKGLNVTITPSSTTSRFILTGKLCISCTVDSFNAHWRIVRGSTEIGSGLRTGASATSIWGAHGSVRAWTAAGTFECPFNYVDIPATTLPITYRIQVLQTYQSNTVFVNRAIETAWQSAGVSSLTVMEIQA